MWFKYYVRLNRLDKIDLTVFLIVPIVLCHIFRIFIMSCLSLNFRLNKVVGDVFVFNLIVSCDIVSSPIIVQHKHFTALLDLKILASLGLIHFITTEKSFQSPLKLDLLLSDTRITSKEYNDRNLKGEAHVLVDVRPSHHYKITSSKFLKHSFSKFGRKDVQNISSLSKRGKKAETIDNSQEASLYVICRRGNDSQRAVELFHNLGFLWLWTSSGGLSRGHTMWIHNSRHTNNGF
ncbi:Adenylyltransferase and sulfurtransferase MOCS3 [Orobanche minor]